MLPPRIIVVPPEATAVGSAKFVMVRLVVLEQPLASVIVQVYVPSARPLAVVPVPPDGDQE